MAHDGCNFYFSFWAFFALLHPLTTLKTKIKKKKNGKKKTPEDIIILQMCTKTYDHMMYSSWDMVRNGQTDGEGDI